MKRLYLFTEFMYPSICSAKCWGTSSMQHGWLSFCKNGLSTFYMLGTSLKNGMQWKSYPALLIRSQSDEFFLLLALTFCSLSSLPPRGSITLKEATHPLISLGEILSRKAVETQQPWWQSHNWGAPTAQ